MKTKLIDFLLSKLRGYAVTWPTSVIGVVLIVNALTGILMCALDPTCGTDVFSHEWEKIVQALAGWGFLESRSVKARSEEVQAWAIGFIAVSLLFASSNVNAGETLETPTKIQLPEVPQVSEPNWLDRGSLWTFAWYDFSAEENGTGLRFGYDLEDTVSLPLRVRFDYLVAGFALDEGTFAETSEATLSLRYDLHPGNSWFPYLIAGGGSSSLSTFDLQYLAGAGVEYEFSNGLALFGEFLHIRDEHESDYRNEIRIGAGITFETLTKIRTLWPKNTTLPNPPTLPAEK